MIRFFFCCSFIFIFSFFASAKTLTEILNEDQDLFSIIILKNDKQIFSNFYNGKTENDLFNAQSVTKSIMAILIGIAIEKGYIKSVDQKIVDFFPYLLNDTDRRKRQITIRHLLNQTSGIKDIEYPEIMNWLSNKNPTRMILEQPLIAKPGTKYQYSTAASHLLSAIITYATKRSTEKFAETNLFNPLAITSFRWNKLNDGINGGGGFCLWMKTSDLAKIGDLLLNNGKMYGRQIVPQSWIEQMFDKDNKLKAPWGLKGSVHGFCWYDAEYRNLVVHYAFGYGGQFIFLFPELNAVVAINRNHNVEDGIRKSYQFIDKYFPYIFDLILQH